jgi:hypothetical protein
MSDVPRNSWLSRLFSCFSPQSPEQAAQLTAVSTWFHPVFDVQLVPMRELRAPPPTPGKFPDSTPHAAASATPPPASAAPPSAPTAPPPAPAAPVPLATPPVENPYDHQMSERRIQKRSRNSPTSCRKPSNCSVILAPQSIHSDEAAFCL